MHITNTINVNVDSKIEKESTEIFKDLGIDMNTAINMFLIQVIRTKSIPFDLISSKPNKKLKNVLK